MRNKSLGKRVSAILLSSAMVLSTMPASVFAEEIEIPAEEIALPAEETVVLDEAEAEAVVEELPVEEEITIGDEAVPEEIAIEEAAEEAFAIEDEAEAQEADIEAEEDVAVDEIFVLQEDVASLSGEDTSLGQIEVAGKSIYYYYGTPDSDTEYYAGDKTVTGSELSKVADYDLYYITDITEEEAVYGTATMSFAEYYGPETTVQTYDAVASSTTSKSALFANGDATTPVDGVGYTINGMKNVNVKASKLDVAIAKVLESTNQLPDSGLYAEAAALVLNEDQAELTQYKTLKSDGTYSAFTRNVVDTVTDATVAVKTTSVWGDYEIDVTETSTAHIRLNRNDEMKDINSNLQGMILTATDGTSVGLRFLAETWVMPWEASFNLGSAAAVALVGKTINKVTYILQNSTYVYEFAQGAVVAPQAEFSATASFDNASAMTIDAYSVPDDAGNVTVDVYVQKGHSYTYYAQDAAITEGKITLTTPVDAAADYGVSIKTEKYADVKLTVAAAPAVGVAVLDDEMAYIQAAPVEGTTYVTEKDAYPVDSFRIVTGVDTDLYVASAIAEDAVVYGTTAMSFAEYYAGETTLKTYDAVASSTTSKNALFANEDSTTPDETGYTINGVKNVNVKVLEQDIALAKVLQAVEKLPETGVLAKAAAVAVNEDQTALAQYKTLNEDGTYSAFTQNVVDTVNDATVAVKTTSVWGDYEIDVTETSTAHIRLNRNDEQKDINATTLQGMVVTTGDGTSVGLRFLAETWAMPWEAAFMADSYAAKELIGKTISSVTYFTPNTTYVFNFETGAYVKPKSDAVATASFVDANTVQVDTFSLPDDIKDRKVSVYLQSGHSLIAYAQSADIGEDETVALTTPGVAGKTYIVSIESSNYADFKTNTYFPIDFSEAVVTVDPAEYEYTGAYLEPAVTVTLNNQVIDPAQYDLTYANNKNAGTAKITVTGKGYNIGTATGSFKINPYDLNAHDVTVKISTSTYTYNGAAKNPYCVLYEGSKQLNHMYVTETRINNINAGTGTLIITGRWNFTGELRANFTINKKAPAISAFNKTIKTKTTAQTLALNAKTNSSAALTYKTSNSRITVNSAGVATIPANFVGSVNIQITAPENANYKMARKTITLQVNPADVAIASIKNTAAGTMTLTWAKSASASGYQVQYSLDSKFASGVITKTVAGQSKVSLKVAGLTKGKTYYVRLRAYNKIGSNTYCSSWYQKSLKITK